jgi:hypothetical protein
MDCASFAAYKEMHRFIKIVLDKMQLYCLKLQSRASTARVLQQRTGHRNCYGKEVVLLEAAGAKV